MPDITPLDFLREKLGWHIPEDVELEDIAYPWSPEDLDLDELTKNEFLSVNSSPILPDQSTDV